MLNAGHDIQNVLESVANHSCNSVTATYYLLQQKHRTKKELTNNNNIVHNKIIESKNHINLLNAFNRPEKNIPIDMTKLRNVEENDFENNRVEDILNEKVVIYKGHLAIECNQIRENVDLNNNSNYNENNNMKKNIHTINNINKNNSNNNNSNNIKNLNIDYHDSSPMISPRQIVQQPVQHFQPAPPASSFFSSSASKGQRPRGGTNAKRTYFS